MVTYAKKRILTNAEIIALPTTSIEIVPAPGAGKILLFRGATFYKPPLTADYTGWDDFDIIRIVYAGQITGSLDVGIQRDNTANPGFDDLLNLLTGAVNYNVFTDPPFFYYSSTSGYQRPIIINGEVDVVNTALQLNASIASGNFGGGHANNTITVQVFYEIIKAL